MGLYRLAVVQITEEKGKPEDSPIEADGITPFLGHTHSMTTFSFAVVTLGERCVAKQFRQLQVLKLDLFLTVVIFVYPVAKCGCHP